MENVKLTLKIENDEEPIILPEFIDVFKIVCDEERYIDFCGLHEYYHKIKYVLNDYSKAKDRARSVMSSLYDYLQNFDYNKGIKNDKYIHLSENGHNIKIENDTYNDVNTTVYKTVYRYDNKNHVYVPYSEPRSVYVRYFDATDERE